MEAHRLRPRRTSSSISYTDALAVVREAARNQACALSEATESLPLEAALGRLVAESVLSPLETPAFDNSAMDGYAVSSSLTSYATPQAPVRLTVVGTVAAGDKPLQVHCEVGKDGLVPCVEIMTGAAFPESLTGGNSFDACIPWEQVSDIGTSGCGGEKYITEPARPNQHKRLAGSDFRKEDPIICSGTVISPENIMALASVGINAIKVRRKLRVGVLSTGSELRDASRPSPNSATHGVFDANGPFLTAALEHLGAEVRYIAPVKDDVDELVSEIRKILGQSPLDIMITTGAISTGKFDFVRVSLERLGAQIVFHHVAMRPGHPVLFAELQRGTLRAADAARNNEPEKDAYEHSRTAIFGLPGNPVASAATFQFLVVPFLRQLQGLAENEGVSAKVVANCSSMRCLQPLSEGGDPKLILQCRVRGLDLFRHGFLRTCGHGQVIVQMNPEQSPAKIKQFAAANCWIYVPSGHGDVKEGDVLRCYPLPSAHCN